MNEMKLYHWRSLYLAGWDEGDLIVVANSIEEAKKLIIKKMIEESDFNPIYYKNEKDHIPETLFNDLKKKPTIYDLPVAMKFLGSD